MNIEFKIRPAVQGDLARINEIYNHYVLSSTCSFQTSPESLESRTAWFESHGVSHPVLVADRGGLVLGWAAVSPYKSREAYRYTGEVAVYVDQEHHRQGIGRSLLGALIARAQEEGFRSLIAAIAAEQGPSLELHQSLGFQEIGRLAEAGYKFGRWLDVIHLQLMLDQPPATVEDS